MHKVLIPIAAFFVAIATAGCNSHAYYAEAQQYHAAAREILIAKGICANEQDCQKRELLFFEAGEFSLGFVRWGGAYINLYETQDNALVGEVVTKFKEVHTRLTKPRVTLTVYSSKHSEPKVKFSEVDIE